MPTKRNGPVGAGPQNEDEDKSILAEKNTSDKFGPSPASADSALRIAQSEQLLSRIRAERGSLRLTSFQRKALNDIGLNLTRLERAIEALSAAGLIRIELDAQGFIVLHSSTDVRRRDARE